MNLKQMTSKCNWNLVQDEPSSHYFITLFIQISEGLIYSQNLPQTQNNDNLSWYSKGLMDVISTIQPNITK